MKRFKGFSLIEMLLVISIILVFIAVFQSSFKPRDMQIYNWQKCVNDLYSFINKFTMAGLSSKWFNSWLTMIYPSAYRTQILPSQNKVINSISTGIVYIEQSSTNLSGTNTSQNVCYINSVYHMLLSWEDVDMEINKWELNNQFDLSGVSNSITSQINLFLCKSGSVCIQMGQYLIDKRNQTITKRVCLGFSWSDCLKWNQ